MNWTQLDWPALDRLRDGFLHGGAAKGPYWESESALDSYDRTYAERIGWKWDHVLRELRQRHWRPQARTVLDWGCGSGMAARRVLACFGPEHFDTLHCWDHEALAADYAAQTARREFPHLNVAAVTPGFLQGTEPVGLLLISHVLNELSADALAGLRQVIDRAESVVWVEPGTAEISRGLGLIRDAVKDRFNLIAPCTHRQTCPVFSAGNERHWCHFFAPPPAEIFSDPDWVKFGRRAGIDLRSLPYSFLVLDRRAPAIAPDWSRIIGRPEHFKPYARFLNCDAAGLVTLTLPKRANPALFKALDRTKSPLVYRWTRTGDKVTDGRLLGDT
jgi:diadenosine tetraphosphatase ApaH/serine/threonine PP2A family protein phosphatase